MAGMTLYDKLWHSHLVEERDDGSALIYIDRIIQRNASFMITSLNIHRLLITR